MEFMSKNKESNRSDRPGIVVEGQSDEVSPYERAVLLAMEGDDVRIDHIVKMDSRGVVVLPSEVRERSDIGRKGDLLLSIVKAGTTTAILLIPANSVHYASSDRTEAQSLRPITRRSLTCDDP